jgi:hypothetical protein
MVHPYWGNLVICAELDGDQHEHPEPNMILLNEMCDSCGSVLTTCLNCGTYIECCPCGAHHALECPWPL